MSDAITSGTVVTLHYTLTLGDGSVDSTKDSEPIEYLHGHGNIVPGLEQALEGKGVGDEVQAEIPADEGYGPRDPDGLKEVPRSQFPEEAELEAGMQVAAEDADGKVFPIWIAKVAGDQVTIDLNHPLAGEDLKFEVEVVAMREATKEEIEHGHPHSPDGCDDH